MENQLELKHLAPYLPYGLKCCLMGEIDEETDKPIQFLIEGANTEFVEVWSNKTITDQWHYEDVFPILRSLSDLTKEIEVNGEIFLPIMRLYGGNNYKEYNYKIEVVDRPILGKVIYISVEGLDNPCISFSLKNILNNQLDYDNWSLLFKWHFDVFGLIEKGLAIDINTL